MDRDVSVPLRYIAPSEPLRVGEACLKDIRHDILVLPSADCVINFAQLLIKLAVVFFTYLIS